MFVRWNRPGANWDKVAEIKVTGASAWIIYLNSERWEISSSYVKQISCVENFLVGK